MVKLVNDVTGEQVDLRFVRDLSIKFVDLPPELEAEFKELARFREQWQRYLYQSLAVPEWLVLGDKSNTTTEP